MTDIIELIEQHFGEEELSVLQQLGKIEERLIYLQVIAESEYGSGYSEKELEEQNAFCKEIYMVRKLQNFLIDLQSVVDKECTKSIVSINESLDLKLSETNQLLVYGSLRTGMDNHYLLNESVYQEKFVIDHCVMLQSHYISFPFCLYSHKSEDTVVVESYQVSEEQLKYLDLVESHPDFYHRHLIKTNDNQLYWIYLIQPKILIKYYSDIKFETISDFVKYSLDKDNE